MTSRKKKRSPQLPGGQMSMTNKRGGLLSPSIVKYTFDNRSGIECLTQSGTRLIPNRHHTGWLNNSLDQIDTSSGVHPQITNLMGTVVSRKEQYGIIASGSNVKHLSPTTTHIRQQYRLDFCEAALMRASLHCSGPQ